MFGTGCSTTVAKLNSPAQRFCARRVRVDLRQAGDAVGRRVLEPERFLVVLAHALGHLRVVVENQLRDLLEQLACAKQRNRHGLELGKGVLHEQRKRCLTGCASSCREDCDFHGRQAHGYRSGEHGDRRCFSCQQTRTKKVSCAHEIGVRLASTGASKHVPKRRGVRQHTCCCRSFHCSRSMIALMSAWAPSERYKILAHAWRKLSWNFT